MILAPYAASTMDEDTEVPSVHSLAVLTKTDLQEIARGRVTLSRAQLRNKLAMLRRLLDTEDGVIIASFDLRKSEH